MNRPGFSGEVSGIPGDDSVRGIQDVGEQSLNVGLCPRWESNPDVPLGAAKFKPGVYDIPGIVLAVLFTAVSATAGLCRMSGRGID